MKINKKIALIIEILLVCALLICTFFISSNTRYILSIIVLAFTITIYFLMKKNNIPYVSKDKVKISMLIFAILYVALFYTLGIYTGYYHSIVKFNLKNLLIYILPITITIIGTEIIRNKLLVFENKKSQIVVLIITIAIDVLLYIDIYNLEKLNDFLMVSGFLLFSSISTNLLFNYLTTRYGKEPIIIYKLITTLFIYIIPITPDVYVYFRTFMRIIFPLFIYLHIDSRYNPDKEQEKTVDRKKQIISITTMFIILTLFICLISCKFTFGALVIGSGSMSNKINKGDVVIFKNSKKIKKGDVIVFEKDKIRIVHRVVKISEKKNKNLYYTKGDANQQKDNGYTEENKILGKVIFRIRYLGRPTLWLREQFS